MELHHQTIERNMLKKSLKKPQKGLQSFPTYDIISYVIKGNAPRRRCNKKRAASATNTKQPMPTQYHYNIVTGSAYIIASLRRESKEENLE